MALSPSPSSAATAYFLSDSMISLSPRRKIGWSSTITIRVLSFMGIRIKIRIKSTIKVKSRRRRKRNRDGQTGALAWRGLNVEFASKQPHSLGHIQKSLAIGVRRLHYAAAIVEDGETHRASFALQLEDRFGGVGVFQDII